MAWLLRGRRHDSNAGDSQAMKRRDLLKTAAAAIAAPYIRPAAAQSHNDTLLTVSEAGPNSLDIMGFGASLSTAEVSWNTYEAC
jgi:peptide/nickel transport system substrate-binding protein